MRWTVHAHAVQRFANQNADASASTTVSRTVDIHLEHDMLCITTQALILHREMAVQIQTAI